LCCQKTVCLSFELLDDEFRPIRPENEIISASLAQYYSKYAAKNPINEEQDNGSNQDGDEDYKSDSNDNPLNSSNYNSNKT